MKLKEDFALSLIESHGWADALSCVLAHAAKQCGIADDEVGQQIAEDLARIGTMVCRDAALCERFGLNQASNPFMRDEIAARFSVDADTVRRMIDAVVAEQSELLDIHLQSAVIWFVDYDAVESMIREAA